MSDKVIIPQYVAPVGPMFERLPIEITVKIIEQLVLVGPYYLPRVVDKRRFDVLNAFASFINIRAVNKTFHDWIMEVFYGNNHFVFKHDMCIMNLYSWCKTSLGPCLPPVPLRRLLRNITITICLEDNYRFLDLHDENNPMGARTVTGHSVNSVEQLFRCCPSARMLRDLTNASNGFCNLNVLHLIIYTNFCHQTTTLDIFRQASFSVRARDSVTIEVFKVSDDKFHSEVADLIEIELGH